MDITIPVEEYKRLVEAAREGEMLKSLIEQRVTTYSGIDGKECRVIKEMLFSEVESEA